MKVVHIFTDGSCLGNPGPGGYAAVLRYGEHQKQLSQGYQLTTNNRMELMAPIAALNALKGACEVHITTDSQYVRQGITQWIHNWQKNNWRTSQKTAVKNADLWQQLLAAQQKFPHQIQWHWVKGHAGHPENELCDQLARTAAEGDALLADTGYRPE